MTAPSRYADYKREAIREMRTSDLDVRQAAAVFERGDVKSAAYPLSIVRQRLRKVRSGADESYALKNAEHILESMLAIERASHKTPSAPRPVRGINAIRDRLTQEMTAAGASGKTAHDIAFVLAWQATGRSLQDLAINHPDAWERFGDAIKSRHIKRVITQWADRAEYLAKGGKP